ncbi:MAG: AbrB/MazE/SpoVT family DNA-binding domain-containing protein [Beijerinckiaceae bacterium]|nr:AbrB/MazE/SpoVT family DNA-binding domain-containing protein [Beijerinckiaceae bacterium]
MRVQIAKWGNSSAIRLPKPVVEELRLKPGEEVELTVEGQELRMKPVKARFVHRIEDLVAEMRRLGPDYEPPYEDWSAVEAPWPDVPQDR